MKAEEIIDQWRRSPDHPVTISTAERAAVVKYVDELKAQIQHRRKKTTPPSLTSSQS